MSGQQRRDAVLARIAQSDGPLSASRLAQSLGVSRQVIVGDIALLRAAGIDIAATPRGYMLRHETAGLIQKLVCTHSEKDMADELYAIVDNGCTVLNVTVEHPIYGTITGELKLASRYDVDWFLHRVRESSAMPLSALTEGAHTHAILCPDENAFLRVEHILKNKGYLLES